VITISNISQRGQVIAAWMKAPQQAVLCVTFQKLVDFLQLFM